MQQKDLRQLQNEYVKNELLQHPNLIYRVQRALKSIPVELPKRKLTEKMLYFRVLPLLEQLEIYMHAVQHGTLSDEQRERLSQLENSYQSLFREKPYQQIIATNLESERIKVTRFDPHRHNKEVLKYLLIQNGACYADKRRLDEIVQAFYHDTLLGGSIITAVQTKGGDIVKESHRKIQWKDRSNNPILAVGKFFICVDNDNIPALAADHYSFGDYHSRSLDNWLEHGKIELFAYGPTSMLHIAEHLGISRLIFCDLEMAEFAKRTGMQRKQIFKRMSTGGSANYDERKAGVIAVVNNSRGVWHHSHSIYSQENGRHFTLDYTPQSIDTLFTKLADLRSGLLEDVKYIKKGEMSAGQHHKLRVQEKFTAMHTLLRIMEDMYFEHRLFDRAKILYNEAIDSVKTRNPIFSLPYVK